MSITTSRYDQKNQLRIFWPKTGAVVSGTVLATRNAELGLEARVSGYFGEYTHAGPVQNVVWHLVEVLEGVEETYRWSHQSEDGSYTTVTVTQPTRKLSAQYTNTAGRTKYVISYYCTKCNGNRAREQTVEVPRRSLSAEVTVLSPDPVLAVRSKYKGGQWYGRSATVAAGGIGTLSHIGEVRVGVPSSVPDNAVGSISYNIEIIDPGETEPRATTAVTIWRDEAAILDVMSAKRAGSVTVQASGISSSWAYVIGKECFVSVKGSDTTGQIKVVRAVEQEDPFDYGSLDPEKEHSFIIGGPYDPDYNCSGVGIPLDGHTITLKMKKIRVQQWDSKALALKNTTLEEEYTLTSVTGGTGTATFNIPGISGRVLDFDCEFIDESVELKP